MVSRKKKMTTRKRRVLRKPTPKKKRATRKKASPKAVHPAAKQLAVYHNPFSVATKQPKIPDGKLNESLGYTGQTVGELVAANTTSTGAVENGGQLDIILYAGRNCGMLVRGDYSGQFPLGNTGGTAFTDALSRYRAVGFQAMNDWSGFSLDATGSGTWSLDENYAYWRVVSTGLVLSLLNPAEEDDGWWEACRLHENRDSSGFGTTAPNMGISAGSLACVPSGILQETLQDTVSDQNSYTTGLLRDLKNHCFKLNPLRHDHDVVHMNKTITSAPGFYSSYGAPTSVRGAHNVFSDTGENYDVGQFIKNSIDESYDMIYIRIHGRTSGNPSRLHFNVVTNQEVAFGNDEREARFQTKCSNVKNMDEHMQMCREHQGASNPSMPTDANGHRPHLIPGPGY